MIFKDEVITAVIERNEERRAEESKGMYAVEGNRILINSWAIFIDTATQNKPPPPPPPPPPRWAGMCASRLFACMGLTC